MSNFDQFTRWRCIKCGAPGIDSWNKALHDGIDHDSDYPNPWILGMDCDACVHPVTVAWTTPDQAPHAIYGPVALGHGCYQYEQEAMDQLERDPFSGLQLEPSDRRDRDWSRGCVAAKGQLQ